MKASKKLLTVLNTPKRLPELITILSKDYKISTGQLLFSFHRLTVPKHNQCITEWLNDKDHKEVVYQILLKATLNIKNQSYLDDRSFLRITELNNPTLNQVLHTAKLLNPLQQLILDSQFNHEHSQTLLKVCASIKLPMNATELIKLMEMTELTDALFQQKERTLLKHLLTPSDYDIISTAQQLEVSFEDIQIIWSKSLDTYEIINLFCELKQFDLVKLYLNQFHDKLKLSQRIALYKKLILFSKKQYEQFFKDEVEFKAILEHAAFQSIPLFTKVIEFHEEETETLQSWMRHLATLANCPLHPFILMAEHGVDLAHIDPSTQTHLMHLAARAENDLLIKFLLSQAGTQKLSAYHQSHAGESVIDIALSQNDYHVKQLLHEYGYDVSNITSDLHEKSLENPLEKFYLIFCGGGIKAASYTSAATEFQQAGLLNMDHLKGIAGASAGAIAAMLFSIGYSIQEAESILLKFDLNELLDFDPKKFDMSMVKSIATLASKIVQRGLSGSSIASLAWKWVTGSEEMSHLKGLLEILTENDGGICPGKRIEAWFADLLKAGIKGSKLEKMDPYHITLSDLANCTNKSGKKQFKDLRIIVVNFNTGHTEVLSANRTPDVTVVSALRASVSIPLIFAPARLLWRVQTKVETKPKYEQSQDRFLDGGTGSNYPFYAFMDKDPRHQHTQGFYLTTEDAITHINKGDFFRPFKESSTDKSTYDSVYQLLFGQQDAILANEMVRANTLFIPIPNIFSIWDFGNPEQQKILQQLGKSSAVEKISLLKQNQFSTLSPQTIKQIAKINCLFYDNHRNQFTLKPANNYHFYKREENAEKLLPLEILKLYARAKPIELPYLARIINPNTSDENGLTALHIAYAFGFKHITKRLLIANANKRNVWHIPRKPCPIEITPKDCKKQQEKFQDILITLGVPKFYRVSEATTTLTKKDRLKLEVNHWQRKTSLFQASQKNLARKILHLKSQLNQQELFTKSLLKTTTLSSITKLNEEQLYQSFQKYLYGSIKEQADLNQSTQLKLQEQTNQLKELQELIEEKETLIKQQQEQCRILNYQKGKSETDRDHAKLDANQYSAQVIELQRELRTKLREQNVLKTQIIEKEQEMHSLNEAIQQLHQEQVDNPINRIHWRKENAYYAKVIFPKLISLEKDLRLEIRSLNKIRRHIAFKLILPMIAFFLYLKVLQKQNKLTGLSAIKHRLLKDNLHSGRFIIHNMTQEIPQIAQGMFSRSRKILKELSNYEEKNCAYNLT